MQSRIIFIQEKKIHFSGTKKRYYVNLNVLDLSISIKYIQKQPMYVIKIFRKKGGHTKTVVYECVEMIKMKNNTVLE